MVYNPKAQDAPYCGDVCYPRLVFDSGKARKSVSVDVLHRSSAATSRQGYGQRQHTGTRVHLNSSSTISPRSTRHSESSLQRQGADATEAQATAICCRLHETTSSADVVYKTYDWNANIQPTCVYTYRHSITTWHKSGFIYKAC